MRDVLIFACMGSATPRGLIRFLWVCVSAAEPASWTCLVTWRGTSSPLPRRSSTRQSRASRVPSGSPPPWTPCTPPSPSRKVSLSHYSHRATSNNSTKSIQRFYRRYSADGAKRNKTLFRQKFF